MTTKPNSMQTVAVDMSPAALRRRLEEMGALYKLMLHLRTAKRVGDAK